MIHKSFLLSLNLFSFYCCCSSCPPGKWIKGRVCVCLMARVNQPQQLVTCPTSRWTRTTYKTRILSAASCFDLMYLTNIDLSSVVCSGLCMRESLSQTVECFCQLPVIVLTILVFLFHWCQTLCLQEELNDAVGFSRVVHAIANSVS